MAKEQRRMRLTAHTRLDGSIHGIVIQPEGEVSANLIPEPGVQVADIPDHKFHGGFDHEQIRTLSEEYRVDVTPATGKLSRKGKKKG